MKVSGKLLKKLFPKTVNYMTKNSKLIKNELLKGIKDKNKQKQISKKISKFTNDVFALSTKELEQNKDKPIFKKMLTKIYKVVKPKDGTSDLIKRIIFCMGVFWGVLLLSQFARAMGIMFILRRKLNNEDFQMIKKMHPMEIETFFMTNYPKEYKQFQKFSAVIISPVLEEFGRIYSEKTVHNGALIFSTIINIYEFVTYSGQMISLGFKKTKALIIRATAVGLHYLNAILQKILIKRFGNKGAVTALILSVIIHGIYNGVMNANTEKIKQWMVS